MQTPLVSIEMLEWVTQRFDNPPSKNDSDKILRWKSAQREVVEHFKQVHHDQVHGTTASSAPFIQIKRDD